ncbi:RagB/SusD family nutrient uptake outer membrane protein [Pedobacter punctiformis]|uniref:RagB/SusD family nutrient uptake outer membrane protein n=1 Tax=Pedobacter punctiformis TaxID=3004097 RepID=A0ABT4LB26_9SPHI|nr:RagB/SusD family nutrient uptake outer membrane protein [Pedobacter sp. HCMS5-2]MCZ4245124.1 RagB/SusD family nutrient uptake outer membrane protein [Pedobacter sp. HCMS5-2]
MKKILYILMATVTISSGCKKFLEEQSQDEVRPSTIQDLNSVMSADGYPYSSTNNASTRLNLMADIITDDVQCFGGQGQINYELVARRGKGPYTWSSQLFEDVLSGDGLTNTSNVNSWAIIYKRIAGCNVVMNYVDKVSGSQSDKENLKGQALAMRGYYYFTLVNIFGKPYNDPASKPETSLGVPLKLSMEVGDEYLARNTVAEVYTQVEADLKQAVELLKNNPGTSSSPYKMNEAAVYALLSRVYLYQEKWDLAIEYANKGLAKRSVLAQLSSFAADGGYYSFNSSFASTIPHENRIYDATRSKEVLWSYIPNLASQDEWFRESGMTPSYTLYKPVYAPSESLMALYETRPTTENAVYLADLRARLYFKFVSIFTSKGLVVINCNGAPGGAGLRVAELYLNRAEANIRKFISTGNAQFRLDALKDINALRMSRYDIRKAYVAIDIADPTALLNFYKDERRREFPFEEGHRWFDLRRYGMPSISHFYEEVAGTGQIYTLVQGDSRYTLPIPAAVLQRNGVLTKTP